MILALIALLLGDPFLPLHWHGTVIPGGAGAITDLGGCRHAITLDSQRVTLTWQSAPDPPCKDPQVGSVVLTLTPQAWNEREVTGVFTTDPGVQTLYSATGKYEMLLGRDGVWIIDLVGNRIP